MKKMRSYNVKRERIETNKDFTINLLNTIYDTYLGSDYIKTKIDIEGHFNWCFGKVLENFFKEEIDYYENSELYNYFFSYFYDQFYIVKRVRPLSSYERFWSNVFNYKKNEDNSKIYEVLSELNTIFDKSYTKKTIEIDLVLKK